MADELRGGAYLGALAATAAAGVLLAVAAWTGLGLGAADREAGAATAATAAATSDDAPGASPVRPGADPGGDPVALPEPTWVHDPDPGVCLRTGDDTTNPPELVDCDAPHDLEVVDVIDASELDAAGAADVGEDGPSTAQWAATITRCRAALGAARGERFDPDGQHLAVVSFPLPSQWRAGDRRAECNVAVRPAPGGRWPLVVGTWLDRDDLPALEAGDCARGVGPAGAPLTVVVPVPCEEPHEVEVVARVVLPPAARNPGTDDDAEATAEAAAAAEARCSGAVAHYLGGPLPSEGEQRAAEPASVAPATAAAVLPLSPASRLAGRDTTFCALVTLGADRRTPLPVVGRR